MPRLRIEREYDTNKAAFGQAQDGSSTSASAMIDRLIDQLISGVESAPLHVSREPSPRILQRFCGRWIILRQLQRGLSNAVVQAHTGIDSETLMQLELGLPINNTLDEDTRDRLSLLLAGQEETTAWMRTVIDAALGDVDVIDDDVLAYMREINPLLDLPEEIDL